MSAMKRFSQRDLRQKAEQALAEGLHAMDQSGFAGIKDYVHELQVYQVELEMQAEELRRTQVELERTRDQYADLYEFAPVGYLSINHSGVILRANQTFARFIDIDRAGLLRKPLSRYIAEEDHSLFFAICTRAATAHRFRTCELRFRRPDGSSFHGRIDILPQNQDPEWGDHYRLSVIDISDRRRLEEEKLQLERQLLLAQKEDSLRRLAGGIAHNFNNLLTVVMGNLEFVRDTTPTTAVRDDCLVQAYQSASKAAELSTMMLSYLGQFSTRSVSLDLAASAAELLPVLRRTVHGMLRFVFEPDPLPVLILGDPAKIAQVISNLVINAVEAIGSLPGTVTIRVFQRHLPESNIPPTFHGVQLQAGNYACLEVIDTGKGMDGRTMERAIDPFFTTKFTGRGLGLSAVWGIIQGHHGALFLESSELQGTTARVLIPLAAGRSGNWPAKNEQIPVHAWNRPANKGILIVDDDPIVRGICRLLLEEMGFQVLEAAGGHEAMDVFTARRHELACVILDFAMPDQDGNLTLIEMRRIDPQMPALILSGYLRNQTEEAFAVEKPEAFLFKPFNKQQFAAALHRTLFSKSKE